MALSTIVFTHHGVVVEESVCCIGDRVQPPVSLGSRPPVVHDQDFARQALRRQTFQVGHGNDQGEIASALTTQVGDDVGDDVGEKLRSACGHDDDHDALLARRRPGSASL